MPQHLVPNSVIEASLLFAVGYDSPAGDPAVLPETMTAELHEALAAQDCAHLAEEVFGTVAAGWQLRAGTQGTTIAVNRYSTLRRRFLDSHGLKPIKGKNVWPVGSTTILKRYGGSWSQALQAFGFQASDNFRPAGFGAPRFSEEKFLQALRDFVKDAYDKGYLTSYQNYVSWRKEQVAQGRKDLPSGPTMRNTYGTWAKALINVQ